MNESSFNFRTDFIFPLFVQGRDDVHVFKAMLWRGRVLIRGHHHTKLHPAHAAAIANVDLSHLAAGWGRWHGRRH